VAIMVNIHHHELAATVSDARETRIALAPWLVP
jgi:hypothetical protein